MSLSTEQLSVYRSHTNKISTIFTALIHASHEQVILKNKETIKEHKQLSTIEDITKFGINNNKKGNNFTLVNGQLVQLPKTEKDESPKLVTVRLPINIKFRLYLIYKQIIEDIKTVRSQTITDFDGAINSMPFSFMKITDKLVEEVNSYVVYNGKDNDYITYFETQIETQCEIKNKEIVKSLSIKMLSIFKYLSIQIVKKMLENIKKQALTESNIFIMIDNLNRECDYKLFDIKFSSVYLKSPIIPLSEKKVKDPNAPVKQVKAKKVSKAIQEKVLDTAIVTNALAENTISGSN